MNRRRFFTLTASVAPAIFIPKLVSVNWKRSSDDLLVIPSCMESDIEKFALLPYYLSRVQIQAVAYESWNKICDNIKFEPGSTQYKLCPLQIT